MYTRWDIIIYYYFVLTTLHCTRKLQVLLRLTTWIATTFLERNNIYYNNIVTPKYSIIGTCARDTWSYIKYLYDCEITVTAYTGEFKVFKRVHATGGLLTCPLRYKVGRTIWYIIIIIIINNIITSWRVCREHYRRRIN